MKSINRFALPLAATLCVCLTACKKGEEAAGPPTEAPVEETAAEEPKPRGEEFDLAVGLPAGKQVDLQIKTETQIEVKYGDQAQPPQKHALTLDISHKVSDKKGDGGFDVEMELVKKTFDMKIGTNGWTFDSSKPKSEDGKNPVFKDLRKAVGGKINYATKPDGSLAKLDGYDSFIKKATRSVARSSRGMLGALYSKPAVARMLLVPSGLPGKPVAEGDTWSESKLDMTPAGVLQADTTYTFEGWSLREGRKVALIAANAVYRKPQPKAAGGGERAGGGEAGMDEGGEAGMDEGMMDEESARQAEMGGGEEGMEGGEGDAGGAGAADADAGPVLGPGELGKASGNIIFDPEPGMVVEITGSQMFLVEQTVQNKTVSRKIDVKVTSAVTKVSDPPAAQ